MASAALAISGVTREQHFLNHADQRRRREERRGLALELLVDGAIRLDATLDTAIATSKAGVGSHSHDSVAVGPTLSA